MKQNLALCPQEAKTVRFKNCESITVIRYRSYWQGYRYSKNGDEVSNARCQDYFTLTRILCRPHELSEVDKAW